MLVIDLIQILIHFLYPGTEAQLYSLRLYKEGLYVLQGHGQLVFPTSFSNYANQMDTLIEQLSYFKVISLCKYSLYLEDINHYFLVKALVLKMKKSCDVARQKQHTEKSNVMNIIKGKGSVNNKVNYIRDMWNIPKK